MSSGRGVGDSLAWGRVTFLFRLEVKIRTTNNERVQRKSDARQQRASYIASAQQGQRQESKPKEEPLLDVELKQEQKAYREPLLEVKYKNRHQAPRGEHKECTSTSN